MINPESGELRSAREFSQLGAAEFEKWNESWGLTERNTAISQATMANKWNEIEKNKDLLPVLSYSTIGDACDICAPLDGLTAPVDDPIWDSVYPTNHFNCLCIVTQHEEGEKDLTPANEKDATFDLVNKEMSDTFKMNSGKDGYIFSPDHPYFDVAKKDIPFAKENFGLPIPSAEKEMGIKEPVFKSTKDAKETEEYMKNPDSKFRKLDKKEEAAFTKNFKSYLSGLDVGQLDSEMNAIAEKNGITWKFKSIEETAFRKGMDIVYRGFDAENSPVRLVRSFYVRDGKRYVEHELFTLPKALQGNGMSKDVLSTFYKQYEKAGINNISIHANIDVGGYAWGKYGFSAEKKSAEGILNSMKGKPFFKDAQTIFNRHFKEDPYTKVFPMDKWANTKFGKDMLLESDWNGGLNLADKEQKTIFESYLNKKK
jgi:hypothetical protein